jgi:hypothetical protein
MVAKGNVRCRGFERLKFIQTCSNCDIWEGEVDVSELMALTGDGLLYTRTCS